MDAADIPNQRGLDTSDHNEQGQATPRSPQETLPQEWFPLIQTLPADLLREIFRRCLPPFRYRESIHFELDKPPYTLAKVCRHWRSICLSTPLLWVDLPTLFTDDWSDTVFTPEFSALWRTNLALSSPCDLRLYVNHYDHLPDAIFAERFRLIQAAFPRVRTLNLNTNTRMLSALSQHADLFKRLHILKITLVANPDIDAFPQLDFHANVASLTLQSQKRIELSRRLLKCVEPLWPNLTKFDGDYLPASSLREILTAAPLLEQLTFRNVQAAASPANGISSPLICTHLKMLHLICRSPRSVANRGVHLPIDLDGIRLPELEDLVIQYSLPTVSSVFLSFLEHTQGSLKNLHIGGIFESSHEQNAVYELCPRLEVLTMAHANDQSLKELSLGGSSGNKSICPRLRHITLPSFRLDLEIENTLWLTMLTSCRSLGPDAVLINGVRIDFVPLESMTITVPKASDFLSLRTFQELNESISHILSVDFPDIEAQRGILTRLEGFDQSVPHVLCSLDDAGIIASLKEFAEGKAESPDTQSLQEKTRRIYTKLRVLVDCLRAKPHWRLEKDTTLKKKLVKFVFKKHLV